MPTKIRPVKLTDDDWQAIQRLASQAGIPASRWVWDACAEKAARSGVTLTGTPQHGGNRIGKPNRKIANLQKLAGERGTIIYREWQGQWCYCLQTPTGSLVNLGPSSINAAYKLNRD